MWNWLTASLQAITERKLEPEVHKVLQDVIDVVNDMEARPISSSIFTILCWLSHGNVLSNNDELCIFLSQSNKCYVFADLLLRQVAVSSILPSRYFTNSNTNKKTMCPFHPIKEMLWCWESNCFLKEICAMEHFESECLEMFPCLCAFVARKDVNVPPVSHPHHLSYLYL